LIQRGKVGGKGEASYSGSDGTGTTQRRWIIQAVFKCIRLSEDLPRNFSEFLPRLVDLGHCGR